MSIKDLLFDGDKFSLAKAGGLAAAAAGVYGALKPESSVGKFFGGEGQQPVGYTGGIPEYEVSRALQPDAFSTTTPTGEARVPGSMGRQYFTPTTFTPTGSVMSPAIGPVDTQAQTQEQEQARMQGIIDSLPEDVVMEILQSMFGAGGISTPTPATPTPTPTPTPATPTPVTPTRTEMQTFLTPFYNKQLTSEDLQSLAGSGYSMPELASGLGLSETALQAAITRATATPTTTRTELQTYLTPFYNKQLTAEDLQSLAGSDFSIPELASGLGVSAEELQAAINALTPAATNNYAQGGMTSASPSKGYYLGGQTDGMADQIPATIEGAQPAKLSDGEFVVPADIVSHLGNGNSDAGAKQLYSMMDRVRQARTGRQEQGRKIAPNDYLPG